MSEGLRSRLENVAAHSHPGSYRPAVDGLRALAVIAVIVNHLEPSWWPFGYLGVDVFFVISGFVVTLSLLSRPLQKPKAFLLGFYSRRVRRLLPALLVTVVVASVLGVMVMYPGSLERVTSLQTGLTALLGGSNLFLLSQNSDYFGISAELNLFLHTWSLGVEEQFYLIFPCLWLLAAGRRHVLLPLLVMLCCASGLLQAGLLQSPSGFHAAFYLMPSRFWELGCGGVLALLLPRIPVARTATQQRWTQVLAWALLVALLWLLVQGSAVASLTHQPAVVLTTTALLAALEPPGAARRCLSSRALVGIGLRSYGLYLWHWPLLVLMRWTVGFSVVAACLVAAITVGLAWWSFAWLETPLRQRRWASHASRELLLGGSAVGLGLAGIGALFTPAATAALWLGRWRPEAYMPPSNFPHLAYAPSIPGTTINRSDCFERFSFTRDVQIRKQDLSNCRVPPAKPGVSTIFVYGDSYAGHLSPLLEQLRRDHGFGVEMLIRAQCPFPARLDDPNNDCTRFFRERKRRVLRAAKPGDVLLLATSAREPGGRYTPYFLQQLSRLTRRLSEHDVRVVLQSPIPRFKDSFDPVCVYPLQWFQPRSRERCSAPSSTARATQVAWIQPLLNQLQPLQARDGLEVWDAFTELCPPDQQACNTHREGLRLYRDDGHLSGRGAQLLLPGLGRWLNQGLKP